MMLRRVLSMTDAGSVPQFKEIIGQLMIVRRLPDGLVDSLIQVYIFGDIQTVQVIPQATEPLKQ